MLPPPRLLAQLISGIREVEDRVKTEELPQCLKTGRNKGKVHQRRSKHAKEGIIED